MTHFRTLAIRNKIVLLIFAGIRRLATVSWLNLLLLGSFSTVGPVQAHEFHSSHGSPTPSLHSPSSDHSHDDWWPELGELFNHRHSMWLSVLLAAAFLCGAMHALLPGHGKTVVAAYLVGQRGTTWHAILLGLTTAISHTGVVLLVALSLVLVGRSAISDAEHAATWLGLASGLIVAGLGLWLVLRQPRAGHQSHPLPTDQRRLGAKTACCGWAGHDSGSHHPKNPSPGNHDTSGGHQHSLTVSLPPPPENSGPETLGRSKATGTAPVEIAAGAQAADSSQPAQRALWGVLALGVSGGLVPCPDAVAMMLAGFSLGDLSDGLWLLMAFSLGLAAALVAVGIVVVKVGARFRSPAWADSLAAWLPLLSGGLILTIGLVMSVVAGWELAR